MSKRRVAVIGAGISGLAALKSCLEEGLDVVCFEQHGDIGGIWFTTEEFRPGQNARIYESLILNTSKAVCCYSDFPFPEDTAPYPTGHEMYLYLKSYAEKFDLLKKIQFGTKVREIKKSDEYDLTGSWDVETEVAGKTSWDTFDVVMVCSGFYTKPYTPSVEGLESFQGTVEHSQTFKSGLEFKGKRILVVGNSNSAGDVAVDTSRYAKQVYLSVGKGTWIIDRCQEHGIPFDFIIRRLLTMLPLPEFLTNRMLMQKANSRLDHVKTKLRPEKPPLQAAMMISDEIQMRIKCGKIRIAGNLGRFGERHAEFDDGTRINDLDGVIFATGLTRHMALLDPIVGQCDDKLEWYKNAFPLQLPQKTLAVIGYFRTLGSVVPISELQARLAARVFAGKHQLPPDDVMRRDVDKWNNHMIEKYGFYKYAFPNVIFRDELAEEIRVKPTFWDLWKLGAAITYQYYCGPAFTVHHRLVGPGAWEGAVRACADAQNSGYANQIRKLSSNRTSGGHMRIMCLLALFVAIVWTFVL